ncbi:hypothetical protein BC939DRAFT_455333 [Gamsiella multidivaricata]|uniref:uncharacterized protein n=1 Tax=Gamsiella multidivaricata TaxID=101098 RepID=UPI00221FA993|nr:uncharacterized protein BC939DRAFT_455333 [Gamsiella multidivaricata]KAI7821762.1 hypothetical protein BC939DRAFT_455333 [Gamsiella multidivaricata]
MSELLLLPPIITTKDRDNADRREVLAIVLAPLVYPGCLYNLSLLFGRSVIIKQDYCSHHQVHRKELEKVAYL